MMASTNHAQNVSTIVLKDGRHGINPSTNSVVYHLGDMTVDNLVDKLSHCFFVAISPLSTVYFLFHKREKKREKEGLKKEYARTVDGRQAWSLAQ
ncbi:hypothetical protein SPHV1_1320001 [Novosphingobium sp. KN65.2]|nr:hypothetical protein SPHV1_1320001 [Novosphingobium sp. KN65.2]